VVVAAVVVPSVACCFISLSVLCSVLFSFNSKTSEDEDSEICSPLSLCERKQEPSVFLVLVSPFFLAFFALSCPVFCVFSLSQKFGAEVLLSSSSLSLSFLHYFFFVIHERERESLRARSPCALIREQSRFVFVGVLRESSCSSSSCLLSSKGSQEEAFCALFSF